MLCDLGLSSSPRCCRTLPLSCRRCCVVVVTSVPSCRRRRAVAVSRSSCLTAAVSYPCCCRRRSVVIVGYVVVPPSFGRRRRRRVVLAASSLSCRSCRAVAAALSSCRRCRVIIINIIYDVVLSSRCILSQSGEVILGTLSRCRCRSGIAVASVSAPCCRHRTAIVAPSLSCRRLFIAEIHFPAFFVWKCGGLLRSGPAPEHVAAGLRAYGQSSGLLAESQIVKNGSGIYWNRSLPRLGRNGGGREFSGNF